MIEPPKFRLCFALSQSSQSVFLHFTLVKSPRITSVRTALIGSAFPSSIFHILTVYCSCDFVLSEFFPDEDDGNSLLVLTFADIRSEDCRKAREETSIMDLISSLPISTCPLTSLDPSLEMKKSPFLSCSQNPKMDRLSRKS